MSKQSAIEHNKNNLMLFEQWQKTKDVKIIHQLLLQNYAAIKKQAILLKIASKTICPLDDLYQEGVIGFLKGFERFDPTKGVGLMTYMTFWIKAAILLEIKKSFLLKFGTTNDRRKAIVAINRDSFRYINEDGDIDFAKLAKDSNIPVDILKSINQDLDHEMIYDAGNGIFDDDQYSIQESYLYGKIPSPLELLEKKQKFELIKSGINSYIEDVLNKQIKIGRRSLYNDVINHRIYPAIYSDALLLTQEEIAEKNGYGLVKQNVEPVEKEILESLQKRVRNAMMPARNSSKTKPIFAGQAGAPKI